MRRFLASLEQQATHQRRLTVRFETPPGHQAQADWAYAGKLSDALGQPRQVYVFAFVLGYSRMLFVRFTTSMNLATLIDCHQQAFAYLDGWPRVIFYDNMKQVKLGPGRWNEAFLDFARHYGFTPKTHRAYRPRTKGKVERMVECQRLGDVPDPGGACHRCSLSVGPNHRHQAHGASRPVEFVFVGCGEARCQRW